jgi:hypothetical protein
LLHIDLYRSATCTLPRSTRHFPVSSLRPTTLHYLIGRREARCTIGNSRNFV